MMRSLTARSVGAIIAVSSCYISATFVCSPVLAVAYIQRLTQYGHSSWHVQDGLFNSPNSIAQTKDGYLWLGTDAGLVRFDGVRFVRWNDFPDGSIASWGIDRVMAARDGSLWIAGARLAQVTDRHISRYETVGRSVALTEDLDGSVWFVRTRVTDNSGPICRAIRGKVDCYGKPDLPIPAAAAVTRGETGFWLGGSNALCHWTLGRAAACSLEDALKPLNGTAGVEALLKTRDGALWVGMAQPGPQLGLGKLVGANWQPIKLDGLDGSALSVTSLLEDREGSVWVGTLDQGIYKISSARAEHFGPSEGLTGSYVTDIYEDREGIVWVTTTSGLDSFRHLPVSVFSAREGLPADAVDSVLPARDGTIWFGNLVLSRLVGDVPEGPPQPALFQGRAVTCLLEDNADRLWIGLGNTLNVFDHGILTPVRSAGGDDLGPVEFMLEDSLHDVWIKKAASPTRIVRIRNRIVVQEFDPNTFGTPTAMAADPTSGMWFGYRNGEIAHYSDGKLNKVPLAPTIGGLVRTLLPQPNGTLLVAGSTGLRIIRGSSQVLLNPDHGLPCERFRAMLEDMTGAIWLSGSCGLIEIQKAALSQWLSAPNTRIEYRLFDETDGVQSGNPSFTPNAKMDRDGRLWFATAKVALMIDPAQVSTPQSPPVINIEQLSADRKVITQLDDLKLPVRTRDIEIQYTALSFRVPQKIQFKYQLSGHDETWIDAGTRRAAFYNDLPPGRYVFKVIACNSDGIWNNEGASLNFEIPPAFYQTGWFKGLCLIAAVTLLYLLYLGRMRQIASRIRVSLVAKNAERERIARELHDTLLQSTQGLVLRFQAATKQLPPDNSVRASLELVLQRADEVMTEGRDRVQDLRTADTFSRNLVESLSSVGEQLAREYKIEFSVVLDGQPQDLEPSLLEEAYAIGREALLNAFTHAQARLVELQIIYSEADFKLRCRDDGKGLDTNLLTEGRPGHFGLTGMRERARRIGAELEIWSRPNAGTELELKVPAVSAYAIRRSRFRWLRFWNQAKE
jgi:signal transduction histidine kinase/ligand-binding sensor domain-containing protein